MESVYLYAAVHGIVGLLLLFFGLRLMKVSIAIIGFVIGFSLVGALSALVSFPDWVEWALAVIGGLILGSIAFAFYRVAVSIAIAFSFGHMAFAVAQSFDATWLSAWGIAAVAGVVTFFLVRALHLVEGLFALSTAIQGASGVVAAVYVLFFANQLQAVQTHGLEIIASASLWWVLAWLVVAGVGFTVQLRHHLATREKPAH